MKDVFDVFNEGFEEITRMVGQGNYKGVNYPALKGGASCFIDNTCITEM